MAETTSQAVINDIPEELRPYRNFLINSGFGLVFTPQALAQANLPGSSNLWGNVPQAQQPVTVNPTLTAPQPAAPPIIDVPYELVSDRGGMRGDGGGRGGSTLANAAEEIESAVGRNLNDWMGVFRGGGGGARFAAGGRLASSAADIESSLRALMGDVNLGAGGSPIGGYYPPVEVSPPPRVPVQIGTGTQPPPAPRPPSVTPPPGSNNGIINTPPSGPPLVVGNPNSVPPPAGAPQPQPGAPVAGPGNPGGPNAAMPQGFGPGGQFTAQRPNNFAGSAAAAAGGYNPNQYADQTVADQLAASLGANTVYTNTGGPIGPPSQAQLHFGGESFHNAGLVNQIMQTEDPGLRELRLKGLRDEIRSLGGTPTFKQGGTVRGFTGMFGGSPLNSGLQAPTTGWGVGSNNNTGVMTGRIDPNAQGPSQEFLTAMQQSPSGSGLMGTTRSSDFSAQSPTAPANPFATTTNAPQTLGIGTATASAPSITPPAATGANPVQGAAFNVLNPYQAYGGQRVLGMGGNFGQVGSDGNLQVSDQTRAGIAGLNRMPSYFDQYGAIQAGRAPNGRATTNLGIANDTFDVAGNQAMSAAQNADTMFGRNDLRSTFQDTMRQLQQNPQMFQAGDITLGQLTAPQLDAPLGVSPSQLTTYQMAGPRLVDVSGNMVNASGYNAAMADAAGRFIDPSNPQDYMSPYQQAVTDQRRAAAQRAFQEQQQFRNADAIRAGAFGGSRQAVADSIAQRDLANQLDAITAEGTQSAYENAQQQFERDRQARLGVNARNQDATNVARQFSSGAGLQAGLANQGVGLQAALANQGVLQQANQQNLAAALGVQELGANQALTAQQLNQAAGLTAGQANQNAALQTQQLARTSGLSAAQANQATRLTQNQALLDALARADQLQQQASQGNVSNNLSALQQQTQSALAANNIGQSRADLQRLAQAMELQNLQALQTAGAGIDARTQAAADFGYQDFINQRNQPFNQLNWLAALLNNTPMGYNQEQVLFQRTNPLAQITGLATAGLGALNQARQS